MQFDKFHLYTHSGCLDGAATAILFRNAGGKEQNVHFVSAGRVDETLNDSVVIFETDDPIIFVDVTPSTKEFANRLLVRGNVWILDHHGSAVWLNDMHPSLFVDAENSACGCEHFRRWLAGFGVEKMDNPGFIALTKVVDDHDRWQMKIPLSLELPKLMSFIGQKEFVERFMNAGQRFKRFFDNEAVDFTPFTDFECELMEIVDKNQIRAYRAVFEKMQIRSKKIDGKTFQVAYVISDEQNNSEMLNLYLNEHDDIDLAVQISFGMQKVSLRSKGKVDCAALAKKYKGGGHKDAAGHPLPPGLIMNIIGDMHDQ